MTKSLETIFKASDLWADAVYKSKCSSVCLSVCPSVCVFNFEVPFKRLFAPSSQSRMSNTFRDSEFLGKSNEKKWSQTWFFWNWSKIAKQKKIFFWLILPYKIRRKPGFPMDKRPLVEGHIVKFSIFLKKIVFAFLWFFQFFKHFGFFGILGPPYCGIGWEMLCLPYAGFF